MARYEWPPIEGLTEFVRKHGVQESARRLGVAASTLRAHLNKHGLTAKDYGKVRQLNDDALREIHELIS